MKSVSTSKIGTNPSNSNMHTETIFLQDQTQPIPRELNAQEMSMQKPNVNNQQQLWPTVSSNEVDKEVININVNNMDSIGTANQVGGGTKVNQNQDAQSNLTQAIEREIEQKFQNKKIQQIIGGGAKNVKEQFDGKFKNDKTLLLDIDKVYHNLKPNLATENHYRLDGIQSDNHSSFFGQYSQNDNKLSKIKMTSGEQLKSLRMDGSKATTDQLIVMQEKINDAVAIQSELEAQNDQLLKQNTQLLTQCQDILEENKGCMSENNLLREKIQIITEELNGLKKTQSNLSPMAGQKQKQQNRGRNQSPTKNNEIIEHTLIKMQNEKFLEQLCDYSIKIFDIFDVTNSELKHYTEKYGDYPPLKQLMSFIHHKIKEYKCQREFQYQHKEFVIKKLNEINKVLKTQIADFEQKLTQKEEENLELQENIQVYSARSKQLESRIEEFEGQVQELQNNIDQQQLYYNQLEQQKMKLEEALMRRGPAMENEEPQLPQKQDIIQEISAHGQDSEANTMDVQNQKNRDLEILRTQVQQNQQYLQSYFSDLAENNSQNETKIKYARIGGHLISPNVSDKSQDKEQDEAVWKTKVNINFDKLNLRPESDQDSNQQPPFSRNEGQQNYPKRSLQVRDGGRDEFSLRNQKLSKVANILSQQPPLTYATQPNSLNNSTERNQLQNIPSDLQSVQQLIGMKRIKLKKKKVLPTPSNVPANTNQGSTFDQTQNIQGLLKKNCMFIDQQTKRLQNAKSQRKYPIKQAISPQIGKADFKLREILKQTIGNEANGEQLGVQVARNAPQFGANTAQVNIQQPSLIKGGKNLKLKKSMNKRTNTFTKNSISGAGTLDLNNHNMKYKMFKVAPYAISHTQANSRSISKQVSLANLNHLSNVSHHTTKRSSHPGYSHPVSKRVSPTSKRQSSGSKRVSPPNRKVSPPGAPKLISPLGGRLEQSNPIAGAATATVAQQQSSKSISIQYGQHANINNLYQGQKIVGNKIKRIKPVNTMGHSNQIRGNFK